MPSEPQLARRPVVLGALLVIAAAVAGLVIYRNLSGGDNVIGSQGRVYTEAVAGAWQRVNPLYANANEVDADLARLVFSGLLRLAPDGQLQPDLAELPQVSDEGRTYTFTLRKNAAWSDGSPLTSADVAFTIRKLTEPDFKGDPALAEGWLGVEVETPNPSTAILRLKQASAPFLARNATIGILPEHLLGALSAGALYDAPFNTQPVGSGPFKVVSLDSREARLAANASYHLGAPGLSEIHLRFYPDYSSAVRALAGGEVNGLMVRDSLSEAQMTDLKKFKGMKIEELTRAAYLVLYLNNAQAAYFQDERVRRAINLSLDRQKIVDRVFFGAAMASSSPVTPGTWAYASDHDVVQPNLAEARQLLDAAGWKPHPTTGILIKDGAEFRFTIRTDNDPVRIQAAEEIRRELEPLGIRATVASTTFSVLRRDFLQERRYEAAIAGWDQGPDPDLYFGWHSSQMGSAGLNLANFEDTVSDELIAKGRTTNDGEARKDVYRQLQEVWGEQAPSVVITYPRYLYVHTDSLKGFTPGVLFSGGQRFYNVHKWRG